MPTKNPFTAIRNELLQELDSLEDSVHFCIADSKETVLPGLVVKGAGSIGLPIAEAEAEAMIEVASQAPYGRGEETLVDIEVRRVWELAPQQFSLTNPAWETLIKELRNDVKETFGLKQTPKATLYKLLIYEEGSFFLPHRDSEKEEGMFATLVVTLPSPHEGGALVVRHDGQEVEVDFSEEAFAIQFSAFYADCWHEVRPVTSGYRVSLIYNLSLPRRKKQPKAPNFQEQAHEIASLLEGLFADDALDKVALPLKHQYTQVGFDPSTLKGGDWARIEALSQATQALGYQAYLALMTLHQVGSADESTLGGGYGWGYGRRRRSWRWDEEEDEDEEPNDHDAEFEEIIDEELTLEHWFELDGKAAAFGGFTLHKEELISHNGFEDFHMEQEVDGFTGNAGVEMERWYRHGVIVVWPQSRTLRIIAKEGPAIAITELAKNLDRSGDKAQSPENLAFARAIIEHWRPRPAPQTRAMLEQLSRLRDQALIEHFIRNVLTKDHHGDEGLWLQTLCHQHGWHTLEPALQELFMAPRWTDTKTELAPILHIFAALVGTDRCATTEQAKSCRQLATTLLSTAKQWDQDALKERGRWRTTPAKDILLSFFQALYHLDATEALSDYVEHVVGNPTRYPLRETLVIATQKLAQIVAGSDPGFQAFERLTEHCTKALQQRTATPVTPPADWSRSHKLSCSCQHCELLKSFLQHPQEQEFQLKAIGQVRDHVTLELERAKADLDLTTHKKGRPFTLLCTKNQASYERKCERFAQDEEALASLQKALMDAAERTGTPLEIVASLPPHARPKEDEKNLTVGMSVQVKAGICDPDAPSFDLSGWQGRIIEIDKIDEIDEDDEYNEGDALLTIAWDSQTLQAIPASYILESIRDELDWSLMRLSHDDVRPCQARDTESQVSQTIASLEKRYT